eukprot:GHVU01117377.1.p1 GENE.GHVU01117377.1~~GHVU01117377.1.p1  ORF type:complete len:604 (-),score=127.03 GHVU01117377.1:296-2107(-)
MQQLAVGAIRTAACARSVRNARTRDAEVRFQTPLLIVQKPNEAPLSYYEDQVYLEAGAEDAAAPTHSRLWMLIDALNPDSEEPVTPAHTVLLQHASESGDEFEILRAEMQGGRWTMKMGLGDGSALAYWQILRGDIPPPPEWLRDQPLHLYSPIPMEEAGVFPRGFKDLEGAPRVEDQPAEIQDYLLVEDILTLCAGMSGNLIEFTGGSFPLPTGTSQPPTAPPKFDYVFTTDGLQLTPSLRKLGASLAAICCRQREVSYFTEHLLQQDAGLMANALGNGLRMILKNFQVKLTKYERASRRRELTLQALHLYLSHDNETLEVLQEIGSVTYRKRGCELLSELEQTVEGGRESMKDDLMRLLHQAARPLCDMLESWIYDGRIDDPYDEFFVTEDTDALLPLLREYDEESVTQRYDTLKAVSDRFALVEERTPYYFQSLQGKIFLAGKYVNILRSCKAPPDPLGDAHRQKILYSLSERPYLEIVSAAYHHASMRLVNYFKEHLDIAGRLQAMRTFFFMSASDFFHYFLDSAAAELDRLAPAASKLETLMETAIRSSSTAAEKYKDDFTCGLNRLLLQELCRRLDLRSGTFVEAGDAGSEAPPRRR